MSRRLYCVEIEIDAELADAYAAWLADHVAEIAALPGVLEARWYQRLEPRTEGRVGFRCDYHFASAQALEVYLTEHALRLRADGIARFGGRFAAQRSVLMPLSNA